MTDTVLVALIGLAGSGIGSFIGIVANTKMTNYRLEQLEKKVEKHNGLIDRTYSLEERITLNEEKIKVANHRLDDLERKEE
jgi:hypothetical protein